MGFVNQSLQITGILDFQKTVFFFLSLVLKTLHFRHPRNVHGLGYYGMKIKDKKINFPHKERQPGPIKISTIFDKISENDEFGELPHRRTNYTNLKRRHFEGNLAEYMEEELPPGASVLQKPKIEIYNSKPCIKVSDSTQKSFVKQPFLSGGKIQP